MIFHYYINDYFYKADNINFNFNQLVVDYFHKIINNNNN